MPRCGMPNRWFKGDVGIPRDDAEFFRLVDEALVYLGCSDMSLRYYSGSYTFDSQSVYKVRDALIQNEIRESPEMLSEHTGLIDVGVFLGSGENELTGRRFDYQVMRARQLTVANKQRKLMFGYKFSLLDKVVRVDNCEIGQDGRADHRFDYYSFNRNESSSWKLVKGLDFQASKQNLKFYDMAINPQMVNLFTYQQWIKEHHWSVTIGYDGSPSLAFVTDPQGVKEVFRLRDIPEGKTRREALRHWVTEHWRSMRSAPEVETQVREHLRGQTRFHWHGLNVEIMLPKVEHERERRAIAERELSRSLGRDRRLKDPKPLFRR